MSVIVLISYSNSKTTQSIRIKFITYRDELQHLKHFRQILIIRQQNFIFWGISLEGWINASFSFESFNLETILLEECIFDSFGFNSLSLGSWGKMTLTVAILNYYSSHINIFSIIALYMRQKYTLI